MLAPMARPKSEIPTKQIALRMPTAWVARLDALARQLSRPGITVSRSEALRAVMIKGLEVMRVEEPPKKAPKKAPRPPGR
jgi:hypothetical protein